MRGGIGVSDYGSDIQVELVRLEPSRLVGGDSDDSR